MAWLRRRGADHASPGRVTSLLKGYNFTLRWQGAGRPGTTLVSEVISGMAAPGIRLAPYLMASWWRSPWLVASIPVPRTELDPVGRALLAGELAVRDAEQRPAAPSSPLGGRSSRES